VRGARQQGLSRRHRFHARGAFGPALRSARKVRGNAALIHVASGRAGISRLGITVTRRIAPSSVVRNRIKRMIREIFRRHPVKAAGLDLVVAPREGLAGLPAAVLAAEIRALLDQALEKAGR
jgi:ribonuclease P protein component